MTEWAPAFALTVLIELPIAVGFLRGGLGVGRAAAVALLAQLSTHPALWFCVPQFAPYLVWVLCVECVIAAVEGALYGAFLARAQAPNPWRTGLVAAVVANLVSTVVGLALQ